LAEMEKREMDVMEMKYSKAGEKRAWDVGKDNGSGSGGKVGRKEQDEVDMEKWDEGEGLKGFDDVW
jgi:hypothetical protein